MKTEAVVFITIPSSVLLIFLILRFIDAIHWSWWWILAPIWVTILLFVLIVLIIAITDDLL